VKKVPPKPIQKVFTPYETPEVSYRIVSVFPSSCGAEEEIDVGIAFSPENGIFTSCRFGDVIVRGSVRNDGKLHCRAPRHSPGKVNLSISGDGSKYIGNEEFVFKGKGLAVVVYYLLLVVVIVALTVVVISQCRKTKVARRRRKKAAMESLVTLKEPKPKKSTVGRRRAGAVV
jgi:hypothetical protein